MNVSIKAFLKIQYITLCPKVEWQLEYLQLQSAIQNLRPPKMPQYTCKKCKSVIEIPVEILDQLPQIAEMRRKQNSQLAAKYIVSIGKTDIQKAKEIVFHITSPKGFCIRCQSALPQVSDCECLKCGSTNFDW